MTDTPSFTRTEMLQPLPPPITERGAVKWLRENLFSGPLNTILTLLGLSVIWYLLQAVFPWLANSVWNAASLGECRELAGPAGGACWAVIHERWHQFLFGFYPSHLYWRPILAFVLLFVALAPVLFSQVPKALLWFTLAYPVVAFYLLWGGLGLEPVNSDRFGGFLLAIVIGVTAISFSLPIGILLALGRQSDMFIVKTICVGFIEFIRGVPLITLLFTASLLLQYFLPKGTSFDIILRVIILVTLFAAAYLAEVIRGGLAALPRGQYEAADALGLNYWQAQRLIILPQALKISIPAIVSTFIGLFKDTTLVSFVGLLDPLRGVTAAVRADINWKGIYWEPYVFVGAIFFVICFSMSRYSMYLERKLKTDHR